MRLRPLLLAALLGGWFLLWAGPGLWAYFAADDPMNLYFGWAASWGQHARDNVLFFTGALRPLGNLFYKVAFAAFGMNPLPYRVVCFALLLVNLWLSYKVARHVCGSEAGAFLTALVAAYHAPLAGVYYATATIYDILAYFFFYAAFLMAAQRRSIAGTCALFVCALNSKEIAVVLPLVIASYEWFCEKERRWRWAAATAALAAIWAAGKLLASNSMLSNPAYRPATDGTVWMEHLRHYLRLMTALAWDWSNWGAALLAAGLLAVAWLARDGAVRWAVALIFLATVPILPIQIRSYYVLYIAHFGWALLCGALVARLRRPWLAAAGAAALLVPLHFWATPRMKGDITASQNYVRPLIEQMKEQKIKLKTPPRVLFLDDPFPEDDWVITFVMALLYGEKDIDVMRVKRMDHAPTEAEISTCQAVFRMKDDRLTRVR